MTPKSLKNENIYCKVFKKFMSFARASQGLVVSSEEEKEGNGE